jgi:phosphoglycerate dehydrogenase-like enzyme
MARAGRPRIVALSGPALFSSFFDAPRRRRLARGFSFSLTAAQDPAALRRQLGAAEGLITTWDSPKHFDESLLRLAPRLRVIAHCGGEVKARFARSLFTKITIANAPGPMAPYVAELALTFLLMAARRVDHYREVLRRPSNAVYLDAHLHGCGRETLRGRTVGIVGFGRIGRSLARLLEPLGARLLVHDPHVRAATAPRVSFTSLKALLKQAEFLVLAAGLTDETRDMIGPSELRLLPRGATVVNVARGGLVDLPALTREVRRGRLHCALDVTDPLEPLPLRHSLRRLAGATLTPHVGAGALAVRHAMADIVINGLERFFRGERLRNRVTPSMLDLMT